MTNQKYKLNKTDKTTFDRKAYMREYNQKPEVKAKKWEYNQKPEVKAKKWEYDQKPEVKARMREYNQKPEVKAKKRAKLAPMREANKEARKIKREMKPIASEYRELMLLKTRNRRQQIRLEVLAEMLGREIEEWRTPEEKKIHMELMQ